MEPRVVSHDEWLAKRRALLAEEKEFTRRRDALSERRRALPWVRVERDYVFDGPDGPVSLRDLFAGREQLIVYHFMFHPDWEKGCKSCSFWADNFDGAAIHLAQRGVSLAAVSRAPVEKLTAFKRRMGWHSPGFRPAATISTSIFACPSSPTTRAGRTTISERPVSAGRKRRVSASL